MIRVAFPYREGASGVANYFGNLFTAIVENPGSNIEPVVVTDLTHAGRLPAVWPKIEVIKTRALQRRTVPWFLRGGVQALLGTDLVLQQRLRRRDIAVVSHAAPPGRLSTIPTLTWLSDVQHRRLPKFFSNAELAERDLHFGKASRHATLVIVSSEDARSDIEEFFPDAKGRVRVLRFVASAPQSISNTRRKEVEEPFVLLPNHFWIHKNHGLVIEAIRILKARRQTVRVVCTGATSDYRHPAYFDELMRKVADAGVGDQFEVLGLVPYADLAEMMRSAVAILNPSLFEGWSTSVEEGKSLGKLVLLSDIPIHREQAPSRGVYFDPHNAEDLADRLWSAFEAFNAASERTWMEQAQQMLPIRRSTFAKEYSAIVHEAIAR